MVSLAPMLDFTALFERVEEDVILYCASLECSIKISHRIVDNYLPTTLLMCYGELPRPSLLAAKMS